MILTRLKHIESDLSPSERKIAEYILGNTKDAVRQNIQETASAAGGSPAAVTRLCKRIGVKGFSELRLLLAEELSANIEASEPFYVPDFSTANDENSIISSLLKSVGMNLEMIPALLSADDLRSSAIRILQSSHLLLLGIGASHIVAEDFLHKCLRVGILATCPAEEDLILLASAALDEKDTAVIVSYSGETPIIKKAAKAVKEKGAAIIAITRYGSSSLSGIADYVLNVPAVESTFRQGATISRISQLIVVDALYSSMLIKLNNSKELITASFDIVRDEHNGKNNF